MNEELFGQISLIKELEDEIKKADKVEEKLERAAKLFVSDLNRLATPYSNIRKSGYTHLVRSFSYKKNNDEYEVGWGKYYGPMVEKGTTKMSSQPHLEPLYKTNEEKYTQILLS